MQDSSDCDDVMWFGGEPLLNVGILMLAMDRFPNHSYSINTNATLARRLSPRHWKQMLSVDISIDGSFHGDKSRWRNVSDYNDTLSGIGHILKHVSETCKVNIVITVPADKVKSYPIHKRIDHLYGITGITSYVIGMNFFEQKNIEEYVDQWVKSMEDVLPYIIKNRNIKVSCRDLMLANNSVIPSCMYLAGRCESISAAGVRSKCYASQDGTSLDHIDKADVSFACPYIMETNPKMAKIIDSYGPQLELVDRMLNWIDVENREYR